MGSKSTPDPPDYSGVAQASEKAAQLGYRLGQDQLDFSKEQYEYLKGISEPLVAQQMAAADQQMTQAQEYYDYQKDTYWGLEQDMVDQANNYNTEAYRDQLAQQAAADAGAAFSATQGASDRNMASMGANPNSGAWNTTANMNALGLAAARAGTMTDTRQQAEQLGWAKQMDAAGLGRGLSGASTGAYSGAINAGNSGMTNAAIPGQTQMAGMAAGADTMMSGANMGLQGQLGILNSQTSLYGDQLSANAANAAGWGQAIGTGLTAIPWSDRRLKQNIEQVGEYPNGLPMYEFEYRDSPGRRWRGVMADDVERVAPEAVVTNAAGYKAVKYDMLGIAMEAVQ